MPLRTRFFSAAALGLLAVRLAAADATVVSKSTVTGIPRRPGAAAAGPSERELTTTSYYKNGMVRTEMGDATTITTRERVFLIDNAKKTFQAVSLKTLEEQANPMLSMLKVKSDIQVKPGGKTQTILGKPAKNYVLTMTMKFELPPALAGGAGAGGATTAKMPGLTMRMELWVTEAIQVGKAVNPVGGAGAFMKPLLDKMQSIKGLPLRSSMTQSVEGMPMAGAGKMTARTEVISIDEKPLPDTLFAPPKGYKQQPYSPPGFGGLPG